MAKMEQGEQNLSFLRWGQEESRERVFSKQRWFWRNQPFPEPQSLWNIIFHQPGGEAMSSD